MKEGRAWPPRRLVPMTAMLSGATVALLAALTVGHGQGPSHPDGPPPALVTAEGPADGEHYAWRPVAIGGGGFITGLSSDEKGVTRVVRADVHGAYRWDARADRWVQLATADAMPEANRVQNGMNQGVYEIVVAPRDPQRLYMAIRGQVFRSDDAGAHWRLASGGLPQPLIFDANSEFRLYGPFMAVSPDKGDLVFLGTPGDGLWRSEDGGGHWVRVASVPAAKDLRPDPGVQAPGIAVWFEGGHVYAASPGHGVFVADVGDMQFRSTGMGPATVAQAAGDARGDLFAIDTEAQRLWRLRGGVWKHLTPAAAPFAGVAVRPGGGQVIVTDAGGKAWCSADGGERWSVLDKSVAAGKGDPPWLGGNHSGYFASGRIEFDPAVPGKLWVVAGTGPHHAVVPETCTGSLAWQSEARGIEELVATDAVSAPGQAPLFSALDAGIHRKTDLDRFSTTYAPKMRFIIAAQQVEWSGGRPDFFVTNASDTRQCCAEDGDTVLAGTSVDGGRNWSKFPTLPQPPGTRADDPWRMAYGTIAVAAGSTDTIVWAPGRNRSPFYTLDRGKSWSRVVLPGEVLPNTGSFSNIWINRKSLAADRVKPATFYLVHSGDAPNGRLAGLWRTEDGGRHWNRVFRGEIAPHSDGPAKLRAVPGQAGHLFFTSGVDYGGDLRLRMSVDGGQSWTALGNVTQVDDVGFGKAAAGTSYPTIFISGRVGGTYGIWRSVDRGALWQRVAGFPLGRLDQVTVVEGDKSVFGRVYVGYMGSGWLYGTPADCAPQPFRQSDASECRAVDPAR